VELTLGLDVRDQDRVVERCQQLGQSHGAATACAGAVQRPAAVADAAFQVHLPLHPGGVRSALAPGFVDLGHGRAQIGQVTRQLRILGRPDRPDERRGRPPAFGPPEHLAGRAVLQGHAQSRPRQRAPMHAHVRPEFGGAHGGLVVLDDPHAGTKRRERRGPVAVGAAQQCLGQPGTGAQVGRTGAPRAAGESEMPAGFGTPALVQSHPPGQDPRLQGRNRPTRLGQLIGGARRLRVADGPRVRRHPRLDLRMPGQGQRGAPAHPAEALDRRLRAPVRGRCVPLQQGDSGQKQLCLRQVDVPMLLFVGPHGGLGRRARLVEQPHGEQHFGPVDEQGGLDHPELAVALGGRREVPEGAGHVPAPGPGAAEVLLRVDSGQLHVVLEAELEGIPEIGLGRDECTAVGMDEAAVRQPTNGPFGLSRPAEDRQGLAELRQGIVEVAQLLEDRGALHTRAGCRDALQTLHGPVDLAGRQRGTAAEHEGRRQTHAGFSLAAA
jgi:hypothetical protein